MEDAGNSFRDLFSKIFRKKNIEEENEFEEELIDMIQEGHEQGAIQSDEAEMISNIFEFGDKEARDVMTIRKKIKAIENKTPLKEAIDFMLQEGYSRYPLYEEDIDKVEKVLTEVVNKALEESEPNLPSTPDTQEAPGSDIPGPAPVSRLPESAAAEAVLLPSLLCSSPTGGSAAGRCFCRYKPAGHTGTG